MSFQAREVFERAGFELNDSAFVRWTLPELRLWLNDGLRAIALHKPTAVGINVAKGIGVGSYQALTGREFQILRVFGNLTDGSLPRQPRESCTLVSREIMDVQTPSWGNATTYPVQKRVKHVVTDPADPLSFHVWPPNDGTGWVEMVIASVPLEVADPASPLLLASYTAVIDINDLYRPPLVHYILARAYAKDAEFVGHGQRSLLHMQAFANDLGIKWVNEIRINPSTQGSKPVPAPSSLDAT